MKAFLADPRVKELYLARVRAHRAAGEIRQRVYWMPTVTCGCAIGVTIHQHDHADYEKLLGISALVAHMEDVIFEGLLPKEAIAFAEDFLVAVPLGADLSGIFPMFALWMLGRVRPNVVAFYDVQEMLTALEAELYKVQGESAASLYRFIPRLATLLERYENDIETTEHVVIRIMLAMVRACSVRVGEHAQTAIRLFCAFLPENDSPFETYRECAATLKTLLAAAPLAEE